MIESVKGCEVRKTEYLQPPYPATPSIFAIAKASNYGASVIVLQTRRMVLTPPKAPAMIDAVKKSVRRHCSS
jgi:hypothetical protein